MSTTLAPNGSPSVCVIFNPAAGRKRARQRLEALASSWRSKVELWSTERPGHAVELGRCASERGFGIVAAAGGDGTVHEVAYGVFQAGRPEVCLAVLPLGSADDYAYTLRQDHDGQADDPTRGRLVDVGLGLTQNNLANFFALAAGIRGRMHRC